MEKRHIESFKVFSCHKKVNPRILSTSKRSFSKKMGKKPSSHIIHSMGGEYCWIVWDSEPIRLLKSPRSLSVYYTKYNFALNLFWKLLKKKVRPILREKQSHSVDKCILVYFVHNCVNNKMLEYDWYLTAHIYSLILLCNSKTVRLPAARNRTGQIGQLKNQWKSSSKYH